jgi:hypothetical protein
MSIFDMVNSGADYSIGSAIGDYAGGDGLSNFASGNIMDYSNLGSGSGFGSAFGNLPWGNIMDTLGRLGTGIGTAVSSYQSQNMPDYYFAPRWAGNGLATYQSVDNTSRKKNNLSQAYGAGDYLNSLFKSRFGGGGDLSDSLSTASIYDEYNPYKGNYGAVGNAINSFVRGK